MPKMTYPQSDDARNEFCRKCIETAVNQGLKSYLDALTLADLRAAYDSYHADYLEATAKLGKRMREVAESEQALAHLQMYIRHLWTTIVQRQERLNQPSGYLAYYQLPADGTRPRLSTREEWLNIAEQIVVGDAQAVAAGYAPVAEPTAVELQTVLNAARAEAADVATADLDYQQIQAKLVAHRVKIDAIIVETIDLLRFATRKLPPATQRRVLRQYGVVYLYLPGESPDPEEPAVPTGEMP